MVQRRQGSGTFVRRGLRLRTLTKQILLVIPFTPESGLGDYITGIRAVLANQQQTLTVIDNHQFAQTSLTKIAADFDGIIYYPQNLATELSTLQQYTLAHMPLVLLDQTATGLPISAVVADNTQGGYLATQTLINNNHQRIIFLAQSDFAQSLNSSVAQRYFGYLQALAEQDLTFAVDPQQAHQLTTNQFADLLPFLEMAHVTGIVTENDLLALATMAFLQKNGVQIPQQFSIIGFDNITRSASSSPQLSTITQDFHTIGRQAAGLLQERIENPFDPDLKQITVPVKLTPRASINLLKNN